MALVNFERMAAVTLPEPRKEIYPMSTKVYCPGLTFVQASERNNNHLKMKVIGVTNKKGANIFIELQKIAKNKYTWVITGDFEPVYLQYHTKDSSPNSQPPLPLLRNP